MRFAPFSIDPQRHVLMREDQDVSLSPHLVDILLHLVSRPGELVTKDALLEQFWPQVNVTENTLTRAIADIRKALGDDSASPRFIQTVARRGYRFVARLDGHSEAASIANNRASRAAGGSRATSGASDPFREWVKGRLSLEALDTTKLPDAITAFEQAVAATPEYAPAHAGLANACLLQFERTRAENAPSREPLTRAIEHARRACELDPSLGEAWASLGFVLTAAGEIEEAPAAARRAAALEPTNWRHQFRLAIATWGEERLRAVDRTLALLPGFAPARFVAAMVFVARQAFPLAIEEAKAGSTAQARQSASAATPFPAVGLHWLHGSLLMRDGHVGSAITEFAREIDAAQSDRIYSREFRVNAQVAAGFAHLAVRDAVGATEAFRSALDVLPRNGRALIGLYQSLLHTPLAPNASLVLPQIARTINELIAGGRSSEAALVTAALHIARGDLNAAGAVLQQLVEGAPPGQTGWIIPIDPALAPLRATRGYEQIAAVLAARAA